jgi:signal transduction histidine kinase/ligand-binding sensor domain-containing protein/DNA-binding response OmpR family regulator
MLYSQPNRLRFENYTIENGLSNNLVHKIYQDRKGWMWFGTYQGLNRFDGYKFTVYDQIPSDSSSFGGSMIREIFEDNVGSLLIGTDNKGIYIYDRNKENFKPLIGSFGKFNLQEQKINTIKQVQDGCFWIGTDNGICKIDKTGKIVKLFQHRENKHNSLIDNNIRAIQIGSSNKLWIGTLLGVDILDEITGSVIHLNNSIPMVADEICTIFSDVDSKIWVGTFKYGIIIIDPLTLKYEHLVIDPSNDRSNTIRVIVKDDNYYWIGTRGGLYIYSKENKHITKCEHDERVSSSLIHNSVINIFRDIKGDIWVATRGGISHLVKERQPFLCHTALPDDNRFLNNSEIYAFWIDSQDKIWIGTESGGINVLDRTKGTFSYYNKDKTSRSLSSNCIKALMGDDKGNLWVGTYLGGIDIIHLKTLTFSHFQNQTNNSNSLSNNKVWALCKDSRNNIWIGTDIGLDKFEAKTSTFIHYTDVIKNKRVLWIKEDSNHDLWIGSDSELNIYDPSSKKVRQFNIKTKMMHEDNSGRFWLTTIDKGLVLFDKKNGIVKKYDQSKGIASKQTFCILEDNFGYLWISTVNGLSRFDPQKEKFKNFDKLDGLQNNQFQYGACYKTPKGELIFGGISGFNIINPAELKENTYKHPIILTDFKIFNRHVPIENNNKAILQKSISETDKVTLRHNQNSITLEFAALNYAKSLKNTYKYKLENFEKDWNDAGNQHTATYTNLNPGEYIFMVKSLNSDNIANKKDLKLIIKILPPLWKTWWFEILVILAILFVIYSILIFLINRNHLKHELIYERKRTMKLHELDMMKVHFYTNVSHELRTPLTLILSPLDKMLQTEMSTNEMKSYLSIMKRNTQQLLRMVNQLLDFRKAETGNLKLDLSMGDIVSYIKSIVSTFEPLAEDKKINLEFTSSEKEIHTFFDEDKLEKIINNLLSNSFKFTPVGGKINISIYLEKTDNNDKNEKFIEIKVKDTGEGILASNMNKIFNLFFQSENNKQSEGSGIGLALTKELVKLQNGRINVESTLGMGSVFTVFLPFKSEFTIEQITNIDLKEDLELNHPDLEENIKIDEELKNEKLLLVADDNSDIRSFIRSHFEPDFKVLEARNGKEGLNLAFKYLPDIVISDILMPLLDGKELCKKLKKDERTSHIPVILLTALSSIPHEREGLIAGADDYVTKPFDILSLKTKVENLLLLRNRLREKYSEELVLKPKDIIIDNPDERFLRKVIEAIETNIVDPDFDIDKLSTEVGVSRTQMYRKMAALTDLTLREFVKSIRLKRAAQLLTQNKMNVSDVAFAVGFKYLSHFRKCFRQEFGMNASEYANRHGGINKN